MKEDYGKHAQEPVWHSCERLRRQALPDAWRDWLLDHSSLTRRLQSTCGDGFRVEVLSQGIEPPMLSEARALGRPPRETALIRQVRLICNDTPWVFARTVVPLPSLHGELKRLSVLGTKPLGAVLFTDPQMVRTPVEVARITPRHRLYRMCDQHTRDGHPSLWGRRSVFTLYGNPLLVSEFFLPELLHHCTGEQDQ
jgi:chorismate--pyruvate lyase